MALAILTILELRDNILKQSLKNYPRVHVEMEWVHFPGFSTGDIAILKKAGYIIEKSALVNKDTNTTHILLRDIKKYKK